MSSRCLDSFGRGCGGSAFRRRAAFSLIEVVLALAVMVFGVTVIISLLSVVLKTNKESSSQMEAADASSHILSVRRAAPTNTVASVLLPALNQDWDTGTGSGYITVDGTPTAAASAAFFATYQAGTNASTGTRAGNIDVCLFWPAAATTKAQSHYEVFTTVSW